MRSATASRWCRHGHDRVYVTAADGTKLGFLNLKTGRCEGIPPERATEFHEAIRQWRQDNPTVSARTGTGAAAPTRARVPSPRPRPPSSRTASPASGGPISPVSAPAAGPATPVVRPWTDLAANQPGQGAAQVAAAYREAHPVATRVARLLGQRTEERAWRIGAAGEVQTAERLRALTDPPPWQLGTAGGLWRVLHSVPVGERGSDIDHVLIGPPGVITINSKNHPGKLVWAQPRTITVDKRPTRYAEAARAEADRAGRLLSGALHGHQVTVIPVIAVVGAAVGGQHQPHGVTVIAVKKLVGWLESLPHHYQPGAVETLFTVARRSSTWQP